MSIIADLLSSFLPSAPSISVLAGYGRHANRVMIYLDWNDRYFCRDQLLSLLWTLSETRLPNRSLSSFRESTATMSSRGGYRPFFNRANQIATSVEHLFKSSDALFARAAYDHLVVEDFVKPAFMVESTKASTDFSILNNNKKKLFKLIVFSYALI
ncbi:hypothetical protein AtNW77_Chr3g0192351 [Arabidopsis thaliana]